MNGTFWPRFILALTLFFSPFYSSVSSFAQETATAVDTWDCLPAETAFAIRIPNGQAFATQFVENTKLGSVMFSEKRKELVAKALSKADDQEWNELKSILNEFELEPKDLLKFLAGETGYAVVLEEDDDGEPVPLGLAWMEPGEDLATRATQLLTYALEEQEDSEHPVLRIDLELAGQEVMQLMLPKVDTEYTEDFAYPEGYEDMSEAEREEAWEEAYDKWEASAEETVVYGTLLFTQLGDRLLIAHSMNMTGDEDGHPDGERLAGILSLLLEAHASGGGDFMGKYSGDDMVADAMAVEGTPCLELVGDAAALWKLVKSTAPRQDRAEIAERFIGADSFGYFAARSALNGNLWNSQLSWSLAQPRTGLLKLFEQESIDLTPPDWIPASAIRYGQFSFDLAEAYDVVKELVTAEFPEQANMFGIADMQVAGFAQANVREILESIGTRHVAAVYKNEAELDIETDIDLQSPDATAIVWKVSDEQIWSRILKNATPMLQAAPGFETASEQGYNGFRLENEAMEIGAFLGNGNLLLAIGGGVVEKTLSSLNNPPTGKDAFRAGEVYQRATELLDLSSAVGCDVVDGKRYARVIRDMLVGLLEQRMNELVDTEYEEVRLESENRFKILSSLLPDVDEMDDILGVGVTRYDSTDKGIRLISVQELPPPDEE